MKRAFTVLSFLALVAIQPAFGQSGVVGKKNKKQAAAPARAAAHTPRAASSSRMVTPVRAHGAPALAHAQAAQHAAAPARLHARSRAVTESTGPAVVRTRGERSSAALATTPAAARVHENARAGRIERNGTAGFRQNAIAPVPANTRVTGQRAVTQNNVRYANYTDARRYWRRERHDRSWWASNYNRIVLYGGGYYYWDNGWWYPAYGYDPYYSNYTFDGPIYGYNDLPPGDVVGDTQRALAEQGYYNGPIDGILGPMTRGAITRYQTDHGLAVTSAIDQQTLYSLGLA